MPYRIDVTHPPPGAAELLVDLGALDIEAEGERLSAILPDNIPQGSLPATLGAADVIISPASPRDAGSTWMLHPKPVRIGGTQEFLLLKDSDAFGTGHHPTTALCIQALEEALRIEPVDRLLDIGAGSGILALLALRYGVQQAVGLDVDPHALEAAADNARLNGLQSRLRLIHGGPDAVTGVWPLVVANILAAPLMHMAPLVARRLASRGRLILSGIGETLAFEVIEAYRHVGIRHRETLSRNGWVALHLHASW